MTRLESARRGLARACALALPLFVVAEVNFPRLAPQTELALFALLGLTLAFLAEPRRGRLAPLARLAGLLAALAFAAVSLWVAVQSEPRLAGLWLGGASLGARAGAERPLDLALGALGLALVLGAAWRAVGASLPLLALAFLAYGRWGNLLPDGLLPHRGYSLDRLVGQTFLQGQGVYGVALYVMFAYVFLFLVLGTVLEATGATRWVLDLSQHLLRGTVGGPAKVAVVASGSWARSPAVPSPIPPPPASSPSR